MTVNFIITFFLIAASLLTASLLTVPDIPIAPIVGLLVGIAVLVPLAIFPMTHTVWSAIDLAMHPLEPGEAGGVAGAAPVSAEPGPSQ